MRVVELPNAHKEACLKEAHDLIDLIESGRVVSWTVVMEHPDGTYSVGGPSTLSRLQSAGALLDAAVRRLNN